MVHRVYSTVCQTVSIFLYFFKPSLTNQVPKYLLDACKRGREVHSDVDDNLIFIVRVDVAEEDNQHQQSTSNRVVFPRLGVKVTFRQHFPKSFIQAVGSRPWTSVPVPSCTGMYPVYPVMDVPCLSLKICCCYHFLNIIYIAMENVYRVSVAALADQIKWFLTCPSLS